MILYVLIEQDAEGYFVASVPALPGCHTQAKFLMFLDARRCGHDGPESIRLYEY